MNTETLETPQPNLNVEDIKVMHNFINVCAQRGAIAANEMRIVGILYDRLTAFLEMVSPPVAATEEPTVEPAPEVTE